MSTCYRRMRHISIHSTARVETDSPLSVSHQSAYFNPLHREGGDHGAKYIISYSLISIHSTARVETMPSLFSRFSIFYFNPLHREGGDYCGQCNKCGYYSQFQSTPPRGWRPGPTKSTRQPGYYFNPLHREGGDQTVPRLLAAPHYFNPLHREGGDRRRRRRRRRSLRFQSTPPRGWRHCKG